MRRDPQQLAARTFDVLVVGGGIYGLTIACDAAARGLSVALVDRDDFGSGSSFNHLRTIHGGLRYLQTLDLGRSRESIAERRTLARIAPHTLQPLMFALPLRRSLLRGRLALRAAFLLDRIVAFDRNSGVLPSLRLPPGRVISKQDVAERFPGIRRRELTGAACWYDYVTAEADRLTLSWALAAASHGAALVNYFAAESLIAEGKRIAGMRGTDRAPDGRAGASIEVAARLTINATGGRVDSLLTPLGISHRLPMLRAMNLVTRRDAGEVALGGMSKTGRAFFLIPWRGKAVFGTWESSAPIDPSADRAAGFSEGEVDAFLHQLNEAFPALELRRDEVTLVHRGIVPAVVHRSGVVTLEGREQIRDHSVDGFEGLISVAGTKYTTARAVAERVVDLALRKLGRPSVPCRTAAVPLPGGDITDDPLELAAARRDYDREVPSDTLPHLIRAYGSKFREVLGVAGDRPDLRARISDVSPVIAAQLVWAARHEMAITLADAVVRRTPLGALGYPGDAAAEKSAAILGAELQWTTDRIDSELDELRRFYR